VIKLLSSNPNFCSNCGEKLSTYVEKCPKCHSVLHEHDKHVQPARPDFQPLPYKSPGTTALIAFLGGLFALPGIGHMYVGKVRRGIVILIGGFLLFFTLLFVIYFLFSVNSLFPASLVYLIYFIWQIFDARKLAKKFNEIVRSTGKEPW